MGSPPEHGYVNLCQVEVTPCKSEGIETFSMVNSPPCQVKPVSSHPINPPSGQVGVNPHKSEGIVPFNLVNSPPGQVGVTPHNPEGIKPFTLVNSLQGQVRSMSSIFSQVSTSDSPCVAPVSPLTSSMSVLVPITDGSPPVMSPLCPLSPEASSAPLKTMQATSHKSLWTYPMESIAHVLPSLKRLMTRTSLCFFLVPNQSVMPLSNTLMTLPSLMALDRLGLRFHCPPMTPMKTWAPPIPMMTHYPSW